MEMERTLVKIVVLNTGSGSQRCSLFHLSEPPSWGIAEEPLWEAKVDVTAPDQEKDKLHIVVRRAGREASVEGTLERSTDLEGRTRFLLERLWKGPRAPLTHAKEVDVIGHRIVHGADRFQRAVRISSDVESTIRELGAFAPLHNEANLVGVTVARHVFGTGVPQVAVFDTAFHQTLSPAARTYPGPHAWLDQGIRRYGFHGTNFRWVAERAAYLLKRKEPLRLIILHLGGGCSLCAVESGRSVDTTMGFTPLDGVAMCTRSGGVDPGILLYLQRQGMSADDLEAVLNQNSGLKGLSGMSGDTRELLPRVDRGDSRAGLAWNVFVHRLRAGVGEMMAALGARPDALVFTDAIGESVAKVRTDVCAPFSFLGCGIDEKKNRCHDGDGDVATLESTVRLLVVKSREAWQIARECRELVAS